MVGAISQLGLVLFPSTSPKSVLGWNGSGRSGSGRRKARRDPADVCFVEGTLLGKPNGCVLKGGTSQHGAVCFGYPPILGQPKFDTNPLFEKTSFCGCSALGGFDDFVARGTLQRFSQFQFGSLFPGEERSERCERSRSRDKGKGAHGSWDA